MAEGDTRIETLEGEPKVLKGEVRRTLVDLRALLMREDSPLNERALARHLAAMPSEGGEPQATAPPRRRMTGLRLAAFGGASAQRRAEE